MMHSTGRQRFACGPHSQAGQEPSMNVRISAGWFWGAPIIALSILVLRSYLPSLVIACVTAIASWPLYERFAIPVRPRLGRSATSFAFTVLMTVFVLAPMIFAIGALIIEANVLLRDIAAADQSGIPPPHWLVNLPLAGHWLAERWQIELSQPGAIAAWVERMQPAQLLVLAQSLGQFMARHVFIIAFTVLVLFFLYQEGETLAGGLRRVLRQRLGERAEAYVQLTTGALRASVNSMLVVGLFDGIATWIAYSFTGAPHAGIWAAITGALALVPFLGYIAVMALSLQLVIAGAGASASAVLALGALILFVGDKVVRPSVARDGTRLPFVWVLMGCLGGFEAFGLVGLVIGPVALTLTRELWEQRVHEDEVGADHYRASQHVAK
jgi:predicted PurR-regulated permease PerM